MDFTPYITSLLALGGAFGGVKAGLNGLGKRLERVEDRQDEVQDTLFLHEGRLVATETELELKRAG